MGGLLQVYVTRALAPPSQATDCLLHLAKAKPAFFLDGVLPEDESSWLMPQRSALWLKSQELLPACFNTAGLLEEQAELPK